MARTKDHEKALTLRKQGKSYSQIKKILNISKSTLSVWLGKYPLLKERIRELRDCNEQRIEKFRNTMREKRGKRLKEIYEIEKKNILPLTKRELYMAGLMLYWGEGSKSHVTDLSVSNTDPCIIKFFINWLVKLFKVPKEKIKIQLHLYKDMDINREINFWSETLDIPYSQFNRPYIKKTLIIRINHKGGFGHGTCNAKICGARLTEKVHMSIKAISDRYK